MTERPGVVAILLLGGLGALLPFRAPILAIPGVVANDNRIPAGRLSHDTLTVQLEVRMARWRPEAPGDSGIAVAAFAEVGKAPQIPAPLLRVRAGTLVKATIRNALPDSTITVLGLATHPATRRDTLVLRPGQARQLSFLAGMPGTYAYTAIVGVHDFSKDEERETTAGAFVVDPPGGSPPDRVFVINIWGKQVDSASYPNALAINGRSWPWTERIPAQVGDTLRWRWVNASVRNHPMHLHGFYFTLTARGDGFSDSLLSTGPRPLIVTHDVRPFETFAMSWVPERPGNWLYHCHIGFHVLPGAGTLEPEDTTSHQRMSDQPARHMAGLILGISVATPVGWKDPERTGTRRLRLFIQEGTRRGRSSRALGFVLQAGATPPARDSVTIPGSMLVLTRGEPTDISVINRLREPAAIHWHGIELESFSDGVAGWSGGASGLAPALQPGDSFVARLTLPRAGTFMYHTHMNDIEQLTSGLYGVIVVLEPGERFDSALDHVFIGGWDGTRDPHLLINGDSLPRAPLELAAGVVHRFRFINIGLAGGYWPTLRQDTTLLSWRQVAKDGAALPAGLATMRPARLRVQVGETWDFEWTPHPGEYTLALGDRDEPAFIQRILVR